MLTPLTWKICVLICQKIIVLPNVMCFIINLLSWNPSRLWAFGVNVLVDMIYTDFVKAFNTMIYKVLLIILWYTEFGEPLLTLFDFFLTHRSQWMKIFCVKSDPFMATSGVRCIPRLGIAFFPFLSIVKNLCSSTVTYCVLQRTWNYTWKLTQ